jgi:hypothetical protein
MWLPRRGGPTSGRPFSALNQFRGALTPGQSVVGYHDAQPFTRFYGSVACDVALEISLLFSNDEIDKDGRPIDDANITALNYDALGARQSYDPTKQDQTGRFFALIFGRWLRFEIKNVGESPTTFLRAFVRGSVF